MMNAAESDVRNTREALSLDVQNVQSFAVNSNTSGMILAMDACGVTKGSAVITTPYTFVSTAACARHLGADVFFADIEKDSYNIDVQNIEAILQSEKGKWNNYRLSCLDPNRNKGRFNRITVFVIPNAVRNLAG